MKALSIRQPWAWAIIHAGKDVENRDWGNAYPALREARAMAAKNTEILIHAAKGMSKLEYEDCLDFVHALSRQKPFPAGLTMPAFDELPRGGIVGRAQLCDVVTDSESLWFFGRIGLVLRNPKPLPFRECKGSLGFFDTEAA